jgi:NTE family protein
MRFRRRKYDFKSPVKPLYEEGCDVILVVHLEKSSTVKHNDFPNCTILEISPTENQGGLIDGMLDFSPEGAGRRIELGYIDAGKLLEPLYSKGIIRSRVMYNRYTVS